MDRVPFCKLEVRNKREANGRIKIRFSIATFALILYVFVPVGIMLILYFTDALMLLYYPLGLYPVLYFVLLVATSNQADKFELDLKRLESEMMK